jgi:hypothetical protein
MRVRSEAPQRIWPSESPAAEQRIPACCQETFPRLGESMNGRPSQRRYADTPLRRHVSPAALLKKAFYILDFVAKRRGTRQ